MNTFCKSLADSPIRSINQRRMSVRSIISTGRVDLQGDIVEPAGVDLSQHKRNPVVLLNHQLVGPLNQPIGVAQDPDGNHTVRLVRLKGGLPALEATTYFRKGDRIAEQVFELIRDGHIRGCSVGFGPVPGGTRVLKKSTDRERGSFHFRRSVLHEYSHTPTPVNPEALTVAIEKSFGRWDPAIIQSLQPYLLKAGAVVVSGFDVGAAVTEPPEKTVLQGWAEVLSDHTSDIATKCREKIERYQDDPIAEALAEVCDRLDSAATDAHLLAGGTALESDPEAVAKSADVYRPDVYVTDSGETAVHPEHLDEPDAEPESDPESVSVSAAVTTFRDAIAQAVTVARGQLETVGDQDPDTAQAFAELLDEADKLTARADEIARGELVSAEDREKLAEVEETLKSLEAAVDRFEKRQRQRSLTPAGYPSFGY